MPFVSKTVEVAANADSILAIVAESGCRYFSELHFPERLVVGVAVTRLGNSSVTYRLGVFRGHEGSAAEEEAEPQAIAAVGHWVHVYIDKATRRPTPIPDDIRALLSTACVS